METEFHIHIIIINFYIFLILRRFEHIFFSYGQAKDDVE